MSTSPPLPRDDRAVLRRILASWYAPALLGLLLVIGMAAWAMPVPVEHVVTRADTGQLQSVTTWDTSRWQAISAFGWQALAFVLAFAAVLGVAWAGRGWVVARASAARFFAASLLAHSLLMLSLGAVPLARAVVEHAETIRVGQAARLADDEPRPARPDERPAYEKVEAPQAENVTTPPLVRQPPAPVHVPDDTDPLLPTIPLHAVRSLPPERVLFVPAREPEIVRRPLEIERRAVRHALKPAEIALEAPELPPPEAMPRERPVAGRPVVLARQEAVPPVPGGTEPLRLPELKRPRPADLRPEGADRPRMREVEKPPAALTGRRQPGPVALVAPREPNADLKPEALPADGPPRAGGTLPRLVPPQFPGRTPEEKTGPRLPLRQPAKVPLPSPKRFAATPTFKPVTDRLPRMSARADRAVEVEDKVVAQAPLVLRQKEERERSVARYGGTKASEAAVERGLDWLAAHQSADGSWSLNQFHANCKHPRCADAGSVNSAPAGTGLALLPFLGAGHTNAAGKHKQTVARALHWLVTQQRPDGSWLAREDGRPMYGHAMASIALCEAYGMTRDAKLRGPAQKALDYIVKAQHGPTGGWRYKPNEPADTSVVGWQLMALKSGEMAGLSVPPKAFDGIKRWLASVEANRPVGGLFGYQSASPTPAMTAQGLLCLQYLGARRDDPRMRAGTDYLLKHLPRQGAESSYYWYHATQVMYHVQGKHWQAWNDKLRDQLVSTQEARGALAGSWKPIDGREKPGGRLYATALRLLMLEVYYRHLPLYQQLEK